MKKQFFALSLLFATAGAIYANEEETKEKPKVSFQEPSSEGSNYNKKLIVTTAGLAAAGAGLSYYSKDSSILASVITGALATGYQSNWFKKDLGNRDTIKVVAAYTAPAFLFKIKSVNSFVKGLLGLNK